MPCGDEKRKMDEACAGGADTWACDWAKLMYEMCWARFASIGSLGHSNTMDERLWERIRTSLTALLSEVVDVPPRPCSVRSKEVRDAILSKTENAMTFSTGIARAFQETGIPLEPDETFACLVHVVKRPQYVSEVMTPAVTRPGMGPHPSVQYIMGPTIMKAVMDTIEQDRIDYERTNELTHQTAE